MEPVRRHERDQPPEPRRRCPGAVSDDTLELLAHAVTGWEATYGLFDPTILGDLERAGYDRSFEHLTSGDEPASGPPRRSLAGARRARASSSTSTPAPPGCRAGVGFDPGGIGKGFAADLVAREAIDRGAEGVLVDLGGDLRVVGRPPERTGLLAHRRRAPDLAHDHRLGPAGRRRGGHEHAHPQRRWITADGVRRHHLIDPLLGAPTDTDVLSATAVAAEGWQAEVLSKAAFIGGPVQGVGLVHQLGRRRA